MFLYFPTSGIRLLVLSMTAFSQTFGVLFDSISLDGWNQIGGGNWEVVDSAIRGTHESQDNEWGHLMSGDRYSDFIAELEFKAVTGNSGFYFRVVEGGPLGVTGMQAEVDPNREVGGIYESNGRQWIVQPNQEQHDSVFKPNEWNSMTITAIGGDITVETNGIVTAELENDEEGRKEGYFAMQVHANQDVEVWFRNIEVIDPHAVAVNRSPSKKQIVAGDVFRGSMTILFMNDNGYYSLKGVRHPGVDYQEMLSTEHMW
jgi:hypothetical protein